MYFMSATIPYCILAGIQELNPIGNKKVLILIGLTIVITGGVSLKLFWKDTVYVRASQGMQCISGELTKENYEYWKHYASREDYDAYEWIHSNTDDNTLIAVDTFVDEDGWIVDMVAGVFSRRYVWNDGTHFPNTEESIRRKSIVEKGIERNIDAL